VRQDTALYDGFPCCCSKVRFLVRRAAAIIFLAEFLAERGDRPARDER
jgi:hypothetical protein